MNNFDNKIIIGFTGSRSGLSAEQRRTFGNFLKEMSKRAVRSHDNLLVVHGDCVGADADADGVCKSLSVPTATRPANMPNMRAFTNAGALAPPEDPLLRNKKIVDGCNMLVACPSSATEVLRSGTWATIRAGRKAKKQVFIITPDGFMFEDSLKTSSGKDMN
jgi:hypothetical protein